MAVFSERNSFKMNWKFCDLCCIYMHKKDISSHENHHKSYSKNMRKLPHGFIKNDKLCAVVTVLKNKMHVPVSVRPVVFLNPNTMKILGFGIGDNVVLVNETVFHPFYVLADKNILPASVGLPHKQNIRFKKNDNVYIYPHSEIFKFAKVASELHLSTNEFKNFMHLNEFRRFICDEYKSTFVYLKQTLTLKYLGTSCELEVIDVKTSNEFIDADDPEFCFQIQNLDIENSPNNEFKDFLEFPNSGIVSYSPLKCSTPILNKVSSVVPGSPIAFSLLNVSDKVGLPLKIQNCFTILPKTSIIINDIPVLNLRKTPMFKDIGGLQGQVTKIKELIKPFLYTSYIKKYCNSKGILLFGPSGTGKSYTIKAIINELSVPVINIQSVQIYNKQFNSAIKNLRKLFSSACEQAPCLLVMDDFHTLYPKYKSNDQLTYEERVILDELPNLIEDLLSGNEGIFVIAATNCYECLDSQLIRHGRFEREIKFDIPSNDERKQIFVKLLQEINWEVSDEQMMDVVNSMHGFTSEDMLKVCQEAHIHSKIRCKRKYNNESQNENLLLNYEDFLNGINHVRPNISSGFSVEVPKVFWDDIGGMTKVKEEIKDMIDIPLKHPEIFEAWKITPSRGILMYGPPGCSKTMIAKAVATESKQNFISVKGPELFNKYVGKSENAISHLFKRAQASTPCIIFFDEIDSLAIERGNTSGGSNVGERVLTQLLTEMDGINVKKGVYIIAATNRPDLIDPALLRPGRFDRVLYVPLPDELTRKEIFELKLKNVPLSDDIDINYLICKTVGYTGAEIVAVCNEAAMMTSLKNIEMAMSSTISMQHFEKALAAISPRTSDELLQLYEKFKSQFQK